MLAKTSKPFSSEEWLFEAKWDGIRAISYIYNNSVRIDSRSGLDITRKFPEIAEDLLESAEDCVIDGEIVLINQGRQDFQKLMERFQIEDEIRQEILSEKFPAVYVVFDILEIEGQPVIANPLEDRKEALEAYVNNSKRINIIKYLIGPGEDYFRAARKLGFEGIMAKRLGSEYEPGKRSGNWLKIKEIKSMDVVVLGWKEGQGGRSGTFGSLKVGAYKDGELVELGYVGTGFTENDLKLIKTLLESGRKFVIEVEFQEFTKDGKLRMPRFVKLRLDKRPEECTVVL